MGYTPPLRPLPRNGGGRRAGETHDRPIFAASLATDDITAAANVTAAMEALVTDRGLEWYFDGDEPFGLGPGLWQTPPARPMIAIIDSGIAAVAVDLFEGRVVPGYDFISSSAISNDGDAREADPTDPGDTRSASCALPAWHGTKMAAAIAAHNVPEGIVVAAPVYAATGSRAAALI